MNNQKGFAPIVIILIVVIILAGGVLIWQHSKTPREKVGVSEKTSPTSTASVKQPKEPSITDNETANWKTYRNDKYGFSFKYPEEINLGKGPTQITVKENLNPFKAVFVAYIEKPFTVGFKVLEKPQGFSNLEGYIKTETENINKVRDSAAPISAEFSEFTINDINGFTIKTTAGDALGNTDVGIYFEKIGYLFVIHYSYSKSLLEGQDPLESSKYHTIQKIISTFRFLK